MRIIALILVIALTIANLVRVDVCPILVLPTFFYADA